MVYGLTLIKQKWTIEIFFTKAYCSLRRMQSHPHAQAHTQVNLYVQFIARAKS